MKKVGKIIVLCSFLSVWGCTSVKKDPSPMSTPISAEASTNSSPKPPILGKQRIGDSCNPEERSKETPDSGQMCKLGAICSSTNNICVECLSYGKDLKEGASCHRESSVCAEPCSAGLYCSDNDKCEKQ